MALKNQILKQDCGNNCLNSITLIEPWLAQVFFMKGEVGYPTNILCQILQ